MQGMEASVAAAMKRSRDEEAKDGLAGGGPPFQIVRVDDVGGKGGSRKRKREKGKADRECFLCGQEGHFKVHCLRRSYVLKTSGALGGTLCRSKRVKAKTRVKEAKARVKAIISSSAKVEAKVSVHWSTQTRSRTGRWNLGAQKMSRGTRSELCPRSRRGAMEVECCPRESSHQDEDHQNSTRRHPEREEKNEFCGGRKKRAKFWAVQGKGGPGEGRSRGRAVQGKGGPNQTLKPNPHETEQSWGVGQAGCFGKCGSTDLPRGRGAGFDECFRSRLGSLGTQRA